MNDLALPRMDATDRRLVVATQSGLPLVPEPYAAVARAVGIAPEEVMQRLRRLLDTGVIRRIGAVPNHYALGYRANAMTVWDVDDARAEDLGVRVGALRFVSHCYLRPRVPPAWRYNLFAMVHGRDREEAAGKIEAIAAMLGDACRAREVLYSTRILKKTGVRLTETN